MMEKTVLNILLKLCREPRLKEELWAKLSLEERIVITRSLLKAVDYSAKDAVLGLTLVKDSKRYEFKVDLKDLKHLPATKKDAIKNEPKIRQNLALAHQIEGLLDTGKISDLKQLTGHLNMSHVRINQLMAMTLLSPSIQEDILLGENEPLSMIPEYKLREVTSEADWQAQKSLWEKLLQENLASPLSSAI